MAGNQNLVAKIIINAQDNASGIFDKIKDSLGKLAVMAAFKTAIDDAAQFELQLDKVAAKGGYTAQEMEKLTTFATQVGVEYGKSGTQAAAGLELLAAAGLKSEDAMKALPSVLA
jgi:TP901 family phage tail tape measure protein